MPLPHLSRHGHHTSRLGRLMVLITMIATVIMLSSSLASAGSELGSLAEVDHANDDMNSTAVETSGATYNGSNHSLFTVDDEHNAYEFALNADGTINDEAVPRVIELDMGRDDFEGVAWLSGQTYAFLSEGSGEVVIANVPRADANGDTTISIDEVISSFPVIAGSWGNLGPEGLATDGEAFYVTRELPATLTKFDLSGTFVGSVYLDHLADASGVAALQDGTYLVISHESRVVAHYSIDWNREEALLLATRTADLFTQLEGIAVMNGTDVYLFGEDNTRKGQTGQTYSHLSGTLIPPSYSVSDVDCSGTLDISDAVLIARIGVGISQAIAGCGSGDHNNDGVVGLADALLIAQCSVGIPNSGCPSGIN